MANAVYPIYKTALGAASSNVSLTVDDATDGTVSQGTFDGANLTYTAVSGDVCEALIIHRQNAGANTTWRLVVYLDTSVTGLPVTPNGGDITVTWNASGIFTL
jgi:hypothetical protein